MPGIASHDVPTLAALVEEHGPIGALTGAGISTASGIPDFRSPTGIWASVDPMKVATIDVFREDPEKTWRWYGVRYAALAAAEPNAGHLALAALERSGHVQAIVTQNIDMLHVKAGSRHVLEVHGSIRTAVCLECGTEEPAEAVLRQLGSRPCPVCPACGSVLKPGVVMFGEQLPAATFMEATRIAQDVGLLLSVGSTLAVWPVAGLAAETRRLAIVNQGPTELDGRAMLRIEGDAASVLPALADALGC